MDKFKVTVSPNADGEVVDEQVLLDGAVKAGWSEDPGTGKAILVPDERGAPGYEVGSPIPVAPPIGWVPTPPIEQLISERVAREFQLRDEEEIDDIVDMEDFDVADELPPLETIYEFIAMEPQVPAVKPLSPEERAKAEVEYEEVLDRHRRVAKRRSREEYKRRQDEMKALYGDDAAGAVLPPEEEGA